MEHTELYKIKAGDLRRRRRFGATVAATVLGCATFMTGLGYNQLACDGPDGAFSSSAVPGPNICTEPDGKTPGKAAIYLGGALAMAGYVGIGVLGGRKKSWADKPETQTAASAPPEPEL